jgi:pimeloyl-ACP methyl ester carboxylesterase
MKNKTPTFAEGKSLFVPILNTFKLKTSKMKHNLRFFLFFVVIIIAQMLSAQSMIDSTLFGKNPNAGHYLKTRGFNMYYETYGKGAPLLFIHGNGGSIDNFTYQIPFFAKNYRVILADSRAQGKSIDTQDSLTYEMMADDFNALLDSLRLDSAYVIGWSDGGINGLLLAMRHPDKVKKMAVTGANLWPDSSAVDPTVYKIVLDDYIEKSKAKLTPALKQELKLGRLLSFEPHITTEQLKKIQCPTLVIGGDHDVLLPEHTLLIAKSIPKSYLWILPDSGHSTPISYSDDFNFVVERFFKKPYRKIEGVGRFD